MIALRPETQQFAEAIETCLIQDEQRRKQRDRHARSYNAELHRLSRELDYALIERRYAAPIAVRIAMCAMQVARLQPSIAPEDGQLENRKSRSIMDWVRNLLKPEGARQPYERPTITKMSTMNFPQQILTNGKPANCRQCSSCHGCR